MLNEIYARGPCIQLTYRMCLYMMRDRVHLCYAANDLKLGKLMQLLDIARTDVEARIRIGPVWRLEFEWTVPEPVWMLH